MELISTTLFLIKDYRKMEKISKYNYFIDYDDKVLLFNGLTGSAFCMKLPESENLKTMFNDLNYFKEKFPNDFARLRQLGYIIDDSFDEISYIRFMNKQKVFVDLNYHLIINPTIDCNFRCWYCYEEHKTGRMSKETIERIKKHIQHKIEVEKIPSLSLGWFGGEPLLCFDTVVYPISQYAKQLCKKNKIRYTSSITTNAYLLNEDIISKSIDIELFSYQITLDGDRKKHDAVRNQNGEPSYDKIIKNINLLCEKVEKSQIWLRINYDVKTFSKKEIFSILEEFPPHIRKKIIINTQRVWQTQDKEIEKEKDLLPEFLETAKNYGFAVTCGGSLNLKSFYTCYASRWNYANINYDGNVYKCTARNYTEDSAVGKLNEKGLIDWQIGKISKIYATTPIENKLCVTCKYLPLCNGLCIQNFLEKGAICRQENREQYFNEEIKRYYNNLKIMRYEKE